MEAEQKKYGETDNISPAEKVGGFSESSYLWGDGAIPKEL